MHAAEDLNVYAWRRSQTGSSAKPSPLPRAGRPDLDDQAEGAESPSLEVKGDAIPLPCGGPTAAKTSRPPLLPMVPRERLSGLARIWHAAGQPPDIPAVHFLTTV